jgi:ubiquinone biosynthesis monooxygenase Coq7
MPLWNVAGFALGAATALLGEKAAHACTEAVETVIEGHYNSQIEELGSRRPDLSAMFTRFRDEEIAHKDLATHEGAAEAPGYPVLFAAIKLGCRLAIGISRKV